jgi:hypothetical protein
MHGYSIEKDKIKVIIISSYDIHVLEVNKKKILSVKVINIGDYINNAFFYSSFFFVITQKATVKISYLTL